LIDGKDNAIEGRKLSRRNLLLLLVLVLPFFVFVFRARRRRGFRGLEQFGKFPSFPLWELQPEMNQHPTTAAAAAGNIIIITVPIIR
jgi:hypothetical protein